MTHLSKMISQHIVASVIEVKSGVEDTLSRVEKAKSNAENSINALTGIKLDLIELGPSYAKEATSIQELFYEGHRKLQNFEKKLKTAIRKKR